MAPAKRRLLETASGGAVWALGISDAAAISRTKEGSGEKKNGKEPSERTVLTFFIFDKNRSFGGFMTQHQQIRLLGRTRPPTTGRANKVRRAAGNCVRPATANYLTVGQTARHTYHPFSHAFDVLP